MTIGELIASCGGSVPQIAGELNISEVSVMKWICGETPDAHSAIMLAEALGISVERVYSAILKTPNLMG